MELKYRMNAKEQEEIIYQLNNLKGCSVHFSRFSLVNERRGMSYCSAVQAYSLYSLLKHHVVLKAFPSVEQS